jgi:ankyrin repeat protein
MAQPRCIWAAYMEDVESTARLLKAGAKVDTANEYGITALALAATNGNVRVIRLLLDAGADVFGSVRSGETPLMLAARSGKVDAVKALLTAGSEIDAKESWNGQTALMWAAAEGTRRSSRR